MEIDYTEKLRNFMAIIDNHNEEIALNYLVQADWDETRAVDLYNKEVFSKKKTFDYSKDLETEINENLIIQSSQSSQSNQSNQYQNDQQQSFLGRYILSPFISFVTSFCGEKREVKEDEEELLFKPLPERIKNFNSFTTLLKTKVGILILYKGKDVENIKSLISSIVNNKETYNAIKQNCCVYSILASCNEGIRISSLIADDLMSPCFLFSFNSRNNTTFNRSSIIHRLEGPITFEVFTDFLFTAIDKRNNTLENPPLSNAEIIEQQRRDLKDLEKQEQIRKVEEENLIIEEQRRTEEDLKKQKEKDLKMEQVKKKIPTEPEANEANITMIIFRYPDGNRRKERRFYRSDKIELLYDFVESLGDSIYTEPENEGFELIQSFPFKRYNDQNKTLQEENLFPNAVIQIKEN